MTTNPFFRLGTWRGITFSAHWTTFIFAGFLVVYGALGGFGTSSVGGTLLFILGWAGSVVIHDASHLISAYALRAKPRKRLSGSFCILPTGSYYILPSTKSRYKDALIALSGPAASALAALACLGFMQYTEEVSTRTGLLAAPDLNILSQFFVLNLLLAVANLAPFFPMDGARVLRSVLTFFFNPGAATRKILRVGRVAALLMTLYGCIRVEWDVAGFGLYLLLVAGAPRLGLRGARRETFASPNPRKSRAAW